MSISHSLARIIDTHLTSQKCLVVDALSFSEEQWQNVREFVDHMPQYQKENDPLGHNNFPMLLGENIYVSNPYVAHYILTLLATDLELGFCIEPIDKVKQKVDKEFQRQNKKIFALS